MKKIFKKSKVFLATTILAAAFSGCGNSDNFVFTNTVQAPQQLAPVAVDDAVNALGNATLQQSAANGVLANDTLNGGAISAFDATGSQGGTLVLNADGSFAYTPVFGFVGAETFAYTLSNAVGDSTATLTLTSTGQGFFVNNQAAAGGDGSQAEPFTTLAEAITAASAGDTIYVANGDGTTTGLVGPFTLPTGVKLIGEGTGLVLSQTIESPGTAPMVQGPITCSGTNTVSGLNIVSSASQCVIVSGVSDVTISDNTLSSPTTQHIVGNPVSGSLNITDNLFEQPNNNNDDYIFIDTNMSANISISGNTFTNGTANSFDAVTEIISRGTAQVSLVYSGNMAQGAVVNDFQYGLYTDSFDTSQLTVAIDGNTFSNFEVEFIGVHTGSTASVMGSITANMLDNSSNSYGIHAYASGGTMTISGNVVSNTDQDGIHLDGEALGGTLIVTNNQVDGSNNGIAFDYSNGGDMKVAIRNNTLLNSVLNSVLVDWGESATACLDITGNTVNDNMQLNQSAGVLNVEQRDDLMTINTFQSGTVMTSGTVTQVNDGDCNIP